MTAGRRSQQGQKEAASPPLIPGALRAAAQQPKQVFG